MPSAQYLATLITLGEFVAGKLLASNPNICNSVAACRNNLKSYAHQLWRRPLTLDETKIIDATVNAADLETSFTIGMTTILASPQFYHKALTEKDRAFDKYQLASKVTFFLFNSPPDAIFRQAISENSLSIDMILNHVERMFTIDKYINRFVLFTLGPLLDFHLDISSVTEFTNEDGKKVLLSQLATQEFLRLVKVVKDNLPMSEIINGSFLYLSQSVADFVGVETADLQGWKLFNKGEAINLGMYPGFLTSPFFAKKTQVAPDKTVISERGLKVWNTFFCETPPVNEVPEEAVKEVLGNPELLGQIEISELRMADERCISCHKGFDPLAIPLEKIDNNGKLRHQYDDGTNISFQTDIEGTPVSDLDAYISTVNMTSKMINCLSKKFASKINAAALSIQNICTSSVSTVEDPKATFLEFTKAMLRKHFSQESP